MMSSACQNRAKQSKRRSTLARSPLTATWAIITASQTSPAVTCSPWQPTRVKKAGGLDRGGALIEQHRATRTAGCRVHERCVGRKQRREHHDVAEEEDPEAVGNDDPLWRGTGFAGDRQRFASDIINGDGDIHSTTSAG